MNSYLQLELAYDRQRILLADAERQRVSRSIRRTRRHRRLHPPDRTVTEPIALPPTALNPPIDTPEFSAWVADIGVHAARHGLDQLDIHMRRLAALSRRRCIDEHLVGILVDHAAPEVVRLRSLAKVTARLLRAPESTLECRSDQVA